MKRIICALLAASLCAVTAASLSGCGCNKQQGGTTGNPSYTVAVTDPDLKDENFGYFIINSSELMITRYYGSQKDLVIPDSFEGRQISIIGHSVFGVEPGKDTLESVVIPETVTDIQDYAFASAHSLKKVTLPSNLRYLGYDAFFACVALKEINIPESIKTIEPYAFSASGLESIEIPYSDNLVSLPQYAFYQCKDLKEVTLPDSITSIADDAFEQCNSELTIKCHENSYAHSWATNHNIKVELVARD